MCDPDGCSDDPAPGLPLLAEAAWEAGPVVGVGLQAFADVNEKTSLGGWPGSYEWGGCREPVAAAGAPAGRYRTPSPSALRRRRRIQA